MSEPSANGPDGRDLRGRFLPGNAGGPGSPQAGAVARLRSAMLSGVTEDAMRAIIEKLVGLALEGNVAACREVLDRTVGKPIEPDILERLERLEQSLTERMP